MLPPRNNPHFCNDMLSMRDADQDQHHNLEHILFCFEAISKLKANFWNLNGSRVGVVPDLEELTVLYFLYP
jgi:hypothetical protein